MLVNIQEKPKKHHIHTLFHKHKLTLLALITIGCLLYISIVLSATGGPNNGGTFTDDSSTGTITWTNPNNAGASDNSYATASLDDNQISHYLKAVNFNFSSQGIPSNAIINGITVEIEKKASRASRIKDEKVRIIKGGTIGGNTTDRADSGWWGTADAYTTYGGNTDLWGETWTVADIESANFGVAISATKASTAGGNETASIDHIRITVDYTIPAASVTNVTSSTPDNSYKAGTTIPVTITFDQAVTVTGTPQLTLETGTSDAIVNYSSGSGTTTLTFNYTVAPGHTTPDLDYISTSALALNGGTITANSQNASLTLPSPGTAGSLGANKAIVIDTTPPSVTTTSTAPNPTNTSPIPFKATFSEAVSGFDNTDITVGNGSVTSFTPDLVTAPIGSIYNFEVTPSGQGTVTVDIASGKCTDNALNDNTAATQISGTYDTVNPTLNLSTTAPDPTNTSPIPVTATFSENVSTFELTDISVTNGTAGNLAGGPSIYTFDITPSVAGPINIEADVPGAVVQDSAGNNNDASSTTINIVYDSVNPTVILSSTASNPTNLSPIPMTATFSKAVSGLLSTEISVSNGTVSNLAGGPAIYTFDVTPTGQGAVTVDIPADVAEDSATNKNFAATQYSTTYDSIAPSITSAQAQDTDSNGKIDRVVLTFDEALADTAPGSNGFDVTSASAHGICNSENADPDGTTSLNINFNCANTNTAIDDLTISLASNAGIADTAGNQVAPAILNATSTPPLTDNANPVVLSTVPANSTTGALYNGNVEINFSEPINTGSFTISDDDSNTYTGTVWSNGDKTATSTHADWTFNTLVTVTLDGSDTNALSVNGGGTYNFSFTTGDNTHLGKATVPSTLTVTDTGTDLSNGVNTGSAGNIIINGASQSLSSITDGNIITADLTATQAIGDQGVIPLTAVTLNSTGPINLNNNNTPNAAVEIPNNTTLYGCATWDGMLNLKAGSNSGNAPTGFSVNNTVYEIGSASCPLLLSQPATILITGLTGNVAYKPTGSNNWYTIPTCGGTYSSPASPSAPTPFTDCAISNGTDTKIITYHFTTFGGLTAVSTPSPTTTTGGGAYNFNLIRNQQDTSKAVPSDPTRGSAEEISTDSPTSSMCANADTILPEYSDITNGSERIYINNLYNKCAMDSISETEFGLANSITKNELSKALSLMFNLGTSNYFKLYDDVKEDDPYMQYLLKAAVLGLIRGQSINAEQKFVLKGEEPLNRAEALYMIIKAQGIDINSYEGKTEFVDIASDNWFYKVAAFAQNKNLIEINKISFEKEGKVRELYYFPRLLGVTDTGKDVANLKSIMMQLDYYSGKINDIYDEELASAIKTYQQANNIQASGNMGDTTRMTIMNEYLHPKTVNYFKPYDLISRKEAARIIYLIERIPSDETKN